MKEFQTYPQTSDLSNTDFFSGDYLDRYDLSPFSPLSCHSPDDNEFHFFFDDLKANNVSKNLRDNEWVNTSEHIFKFPNFDQKVGDHLELTGVTQNENQFLNQCQDLDLDTSQADCDFENNDEDSKSSMEKEQKKLCKPVSQKVPIKIEKSKTIRRDVINKTIFRIIRRYFHMLLEKAVPDYKSQKKHNLMSMLRSFSEYLFPSNLDSLKMAQVMSALMFRREVLVSKKDICQDPNLKVFLDIQSKYSHKLLSPVLCNQYFGLMFEKFIGQGMAFFEEDENVTNNSKIYHQELEKIKSIYYSSSN